MREERKTFKEEREEKGSEATKREENMLGLRKTKMKEGMYVRGEGKKKKR